MESGCSPTTTGVAELKLTWGGQWVHITRDAPEVHLAGKWQDDLV
jgi:hypothetical protein